jgi:hypothetical protein
MWLGPSAALFFGVYGGVRGGSRFVFARFQYAGLVTTVGTTTTVRFAGFSIVHWVWRAEVYEHVVFTLRSLIADELSSFVLGAVFASTWLLFVSGAPLGTALQLWTSEGTRLGWVASVRDDSEGTPASNSSVRAQVW